MSVEGVIGNMASDVSVGSKEVVEVSKDLGVFVPSLPDVDLYNEPEAGDADNVAWHVVDTAVVGYLSGADAANGCDIVDHVVVTVLCRATNGCSASHALRTVD